MLWLILFIISISVNVGIFVGTMLALIDVRKNVTVKPMDFRGARERLMETDRYIEQAKMRKRNEKD